MPERPVSAQGPATSAIRSSSIWARRAITASRSCRAIRSRHTSVMEMCGRADARHITVTLGRRPRARPASRSTISTCRPAATSPIRRSTRNSPTSSIHGRDARLGRPPNPTGAPAILVGDLNIAPLEHDVWSHKQLLDVVSHTPVETEALEALRRRPAGSTPCAHLRPEPEKIYSWWSYRSPDWAAANKGRRLDHIWVSGDLAGAAPRHGRHARDPRLGTALGPRAGDGDAGALRSSVTRIRPVQPRRGVTDAAVTVLAASIATASAAPLRAAGENANSSAMAACMAAAALREFLQDPAHQARRDAHHRRTARAPSRSRAARSG